MNRLKKINRMLEVRDGLKINCLDSILFDNFSGRWTEGQGNLGTPKKKR